eukprot:1108518-Amphidinium_carterae.2
MHVSTIPSYERLLQVFNQNAMGAVYDSFETYNWHDELSLVKTTEEETLSDYTTRARDFYNRIRHQSLQRFQRFGATRSVDTTTG